MKLTLHDTGPDGATELYVLQRGEVDVLGIIIERGQMQIITWDENGEAIDLGHVVIPEGDAV